MAIHIRDATARDLPRILEIERLAFPAPWTPCLVRARTDPAFLPHHAGDSRERQGRHQSGFLCRWLIADECHILNIAVHPESRRLGIGSVLMTESINEAKSTGTNVVTLEVRRSNLPARQLYRKFEFEERRLRRHYYGPGEDAIIMELRFD